MLLSTGRFFGLEGAAPGSLSPTFVSAAFSASASGFTPTWPPNVQENDIAFLAVETANQPVDLPTGYASVTGSPKTSGSAGFASAVGLQVLWKRAGAAEAGPIIADGGDHQCVGFIIIRGAPTTGDPWDVTAGSTDTSVDTTVALSSVTTTVPNCLILHFLAWNTDQAGARVDSWVNAGLTDLTERLDDGSIVGNGGGLAIATGIKAAAGATGSTTATYLASTSASAHLTVAVKPA